MTAFLHSGTVESRFKLVSTKTFPFRGRGTAAVGGGGRGAAGSMKLNPHPCEKVQCLLRIRRDVSPVGSACRSSLVSLRLPAYLRPKSRPVAGWPPKRACGRSPKGKLWVHPFYMTAPNPFPFGEGVTEKTKLPQTFVCGSLLLCFRRFFSAPFFML